jgi:hypothetical protein
MAVKIRRTVVLIAAIAIAVFVVRWCYANGRGVEIRIHNTQGRPLRSVVVLVTGKSYAIGDLSPDAVRSVFANPTGDSHVEISLIDVDGKAKQISVPGSYFEPGYGGWMLVEITSTDVRKVEYDIDPY